MALNPGIILQGQTPDLLGTIDRSNTAAFNQRQNQQTNALQSYVQENGAGIMQGDANALAGYAAFDPMGARSIQLSEQDRAAAREQARSAAAIEAAKLSAEQIAAEKERLAAIMQGASMATDEASYNQFLQGQGIDPAQYPFSQRDANLAMLAGIDDALSAVGARTPEPAYAMLTPEQVQAAGLDPSKQWQSSPDGKITQVGGGGTNVTVNNGGPATPGWEAIDKNFATEVYTPWVLQGGSADSQKLIGQLGEAAGALSSGDNLTGPIVGLIPDVVQAWVNPQSVATREKVEEVVQRNLREVLGAQFTEKEGARLIARAYNPSLGEQENSRRVTALITQMVSAVEAKNAAVEYFQQNGTMQGFTASLPSMADFAFPEWDAPTQSDVSPATLPPVSGPMPITDDDQALFDKYKVE